MSKELKKKLQILERKIPGVGDNTKAVHTRLFENGELIATGGGWIHYDKPKGRPKKDDRRIAVYLARYVLDECGYTAGEANELIAELLEYAGKREVRRVLSAAETVAITKNCVAIAGFDGDEPGKAAISAAFLLEPGYDVSASKEIRAQGWYWKPWDKVAHYGRLNGKP